MKKNYFILLIISLLLFIKITNPIFNAVIYSIAIIPLAILLGEFTTNMAEYIGDKKGGLLAAAVGNIPELTIGLWSVKYGMITMVKASLVGAIISNMLLVLGISTFIGGTIYKEQKFNKNIARTNFSMLFLALTTIVIISSLDKYSYRLSAVNLQSISVKISLVLILVYLLGLFFSLYTHSNLFVITESNTEKNLKKNKNYYVLLANIMYSAIILYFISEKLILNIRIITNSYNISEEFIGIILMPILGNIGENFAAIMGAIKNKVSLSLEIAIGSSIQISLFVMPLLVVFSHFCGMPLTLLFSEFQVVLVIVAVAMSFFVFQDGKTYWFEGAILIAIYAVIALAYYYMV
ncbi:calcium/proton exchanger [Clostridium sp. JN-9]|uniref:calcium/proton exchanger n=1 Tax=Clostridium sp. JN-9 TaxID=2507159 RepID=UPI000FFE31AD|nr:calcium/proton exchanger [Clostridium sp. JN-9]QAT39026.1 calcium/proton exchanger [Clostridium sp. JN-9]